MAGFGRTRLNTDTADGRVTCRTQRVAVPLAVDLMAT
jgi:hypothetical protein